MPPCPPLLRPNGTIPRNRSLSLPTGEVHVWRLSHNPQCLPPIAWESTLSTDEHARANRFAFHRDRNAYITTRAVLRELLGQYLSTPPAAIQFHYADRGKPALAPTAGDPPVPLQRLPHTRSLALLAFSSDRRLGVDVEFIRPIDNWEDIARRFFSQNELTELRALRRINATKASTPAGLARKATSRLAAKDCTCRSIVSTSR